MHLDDTYGVLESHNGWFDGGNTLDDASSHATKRYAEYSEKG
jgi:hypothetical protein